MLHPPSERAHPYISLPVWNLKHIPQAAQETTTTERLRNQGEATNSTAPPSWRPREQRSSFIPTTDAHVSTLIPHPRHEPLVRHRAFGSRPDQATYETQGLTVPTSLWPNSASLSRRRSSTSASRVPPSTSRSTRAAWSPPCPTTARSSPSPPSSRSSSPTRTRPTSSRPPPTPTPH